MKIRTKKTQLKASRIFTDREDPVPPSGSSTAAWKRNCSARRPMSMC